ncbi:hypothetical protein [Streptomyces fuscigenes]|uniref:hypothetical protein n=1 Tax=Streptomyces fuscigenes TaxID=1528880 RepID=UPI001F35AC4F|nr:hypothetical protein [Streptomyces fuscigenes]MCF3960411.1 hypothetical protein [Streptomyces fuscigenes]
MDLTENQRRLLARLALGSLPVPTDRPAFTRALAADGLEADFIRADLPSLRWMRLVDVAEGSLMLTDLGAAVHFRALFESSQERLSEVVRLAERGEDTVPRLARAIRGVAEGSCSLPQALLSLEEAT